MARPLSSDVRLNGNDKRLLEQALIHYRKRFEDYERYPQRNEIGQHKQTMFDQINQLRGKVFDL